MQALDCYISGFKLDSNHIGCIHNVAYCHFGMGNFANAEKWFSLAIKLQPSLQEGYIGHTVSCLKLGQY